MLDLCNLGRSLQKWTPVPSFHVHAQGGLGIGVEMSAFGFPCGYQSGIQCIARTPQPSLAKNGDRYKALPAVVAFLCCVYESGGTCHVAESMNNGVKHWVIRSFRTLTSWCTCQHRWTGRATGQLRRKLRTRDDPIVPKGPVKN